MKQRVLAVGVVGLMVLLGGLATQATAAERVRIGSDLDGAADPGTGYSCGIVDPTCAIQQRAIPGNPHKLRAPFSGRIRTWRFRNDVAPTTPVSVRLRVVRKVGVNQFKFVRRSAKEALTTAGVHRFTSDLRIRRGDFIALELNTGEQNESIQGFYAFNAGALALEWFPAPGNGQTGSPDSMSEDTEYFYNATVKR